MFLLCCLAQYPVLLVEGIGKALQEEELLLGSGVLTYQDLILHWRTQHLIPTTCTASQDPAPVVHAGQAHPVASSFAKQLLFIIYPDQVGFITERQELFNICKSINVINHINKLKNKNHMIISVDAKNAFDRIQHPLMIKKFLESGHRGNILQCNKGHMTSPQKTSSQQWENWKHLLPLRSGIRQRCPFSPLSFSIVLEVLAMVIREGKWNKSNLG